MRFEEPAISAHGLVKSYGDVRALDGVDLEAAPGTVLGVLGPNGAGKTTSVRVLTTLLTPDAGEARVAGLDVVKDAPKLRSRIGLAGQYAAVDENLTGIENLTMVGRLYGNKRAVAQAARAGAARALLARRRREPPGEDLLGRHAAPAGPRGGARREPARAVPRRADHRPGPALADRPVGGDRGARRRRHDRPADDPVPRGGRPARRPDRGHRPRPRDRRGHGGRAQGARRWPARGGHAHARRGVVRGHDGARGHERGARARGRTARQPAGRGPLRRDHGGRAAAEPRGRGGGGHRGPPADARRRVPVPDGPGPGERPTRPRRTESWWPHDLRHAHARGARPGAAPAQPGHAAGLHGPADHVRAAVRVRVRRRDRDARATATTSTS